jgi:hypothetical protein
MNGKYKMCVQNIAAKPDEDKFLYRPRHARADNIKEEYSRRKLQDCRPCEI